jgi:hypothetical protein
MSRLYTETHRTQTIGWLRADVLGANDGIISTASLISRFVLPDQRQGARIWPEHRPVRCREGVLSQAAMASQAPGVFAIYQRGLQNHATDK